MLALGTLHRLLELRPHALAGLRTPHGAELEAEITSKVAAMVVGCAASKHLVDGAQMGAHWLLSLQLLHGALRCLRHLWRPYTHPAPAQAPPPGSNLL